MKIYTFTSKTGGRIDGEYDFVADGYQEAVRMAFLFENEHNEAADNDFEKVKGHDKGNYFLRFDLKARSNEINPGYIDIRDRNWLGCGPDKGVDHSF